jgi:hypothetical protein
MGQKFRDVERGRKGLVGINFLLYKEKMVAV